MKFIFLLSVSLLLTFSTLKAHTISNFSQNKISFSGCEYTVKSWSITFGQNSKGKYMKVKWEIEYDCTSNGWGKGETSGTATWYYRNGQTVGNIIPDEGTKIDQPTLDIITELVNKELLDSENK